MRQLRQLATYATPATLDQAVENAIQMLKTPEELEALVQEIHRLDAALARSTAQKRLNALTNTRDFAKLQKRRKMELRLLKRTPVWQKAISDRQRAMARFKRLWKSTLAPPGHDIVLCGGGIMGIATAFFLAKSGQLPPDATIWIVDPRLRKDASFQAGGMIGRGEGGLLFSSPQVENLATKSYALHAELAQELDGANKYGYAQSAYRELDAHERVGSVRKKHRPPLTMPKKQTDRALLQQELGHFLNLDNIVVDRYLVKEEMAQLHPARFCDTLLEETRKMVNLQCIDGRIVGFAYQDGRIGKANDDKPDRVLVRKADGSEFLLPMTMFAVVAGPWSDTFREACLPPSVAPFAIRGMKEIHQLYRPIQPHGLPPLLLFSYLSVGKHKTREFESRFAKFPIDEWGFVAHPELYVRPGGDVYALLDEAENEFLGLADPLAPNEDIELSKELLETCLHLLLPNIGDMQKIEETSCYYPTRRAPDDTVLPPLVDRLSSWLYVNIGHSQWGITLSPICSKILADLMINGKSDVMEDLTFLQHSKLSAS